MIFWKLYCFIKVGVGLLKSETTNISMLNKQDTKIKTDNIFDKTPLNKLKIKLKLARLVIRVIYGIWINKKEKVIAKYEINQINNLLLIVALLLPNHTVKYNHNM